MIADHFNPPIPFELGHFTLPSRYTRLGRQELRALAATCRKFARLFRPFVTRTLTFQDRGRRTNTVQLYRSGKEVQESVQEVYWEVRIIPPLALSSNCFFAHFTLFSPAQPGLTLLQRRITTLLARSQEPHLSHPCFLASADVSTKPIPCVNEAVADAPTLPTDLTTS